VELIHGQKLLQKICVKSVEEEKVPVQYIQNRYSIKLINFQGLLEWTAEKGGQGEKHGHDKLSGTFSLDC